MTEPCTSREPHAAHLPMGFVMAEDYCPGVRVLPVQRRNATRVDQLAHGTATRVADLEQRN